MNEKNCCSACGKTGACAGCAGGCGLSSALSAGERRLLESFAALPFQPLLQREDGTLLLPGTALDEHLAGAILPGLLRRGLVSADPELPLQGFDYTPWGEGCAQGSAALTLRGQELLDDWEYGGK